ncbi:probable carboxylesterase 8 [Dendrobium catenatum]|uniref:Putative carboxylesterase 8 n=1 Tax=Dendrobium catenatum TaxID=906689 RepID=A0A2I0XJF3_9ASPA|nr:probable carboxylesterase 8 [Dendrobium catenatum]PKU88024.1 putative carboxylesterase 8 [Dendrobium catenatum]
MGDHGIECSAKPNSPNLFLQFTENPDGTITRPFVPQIPPSDLIDRADVRSRDIPLNSSLKTSLRLYVPSSSLQKLPIILFFHGGGFILFNSSSAPYHFFCEQMAQSLSALVLSLDYRLAPDHRLPAAYDDALEAILWLRTQAAADSSARDSWLASHADFDRVFIAGSSSGANMAFHAAIRIADLDLQPLKIAGVLLNQPYLGGQERTKSEDDSENDVILPLRTSDMMWRLALPLGADRDHEYSNPAAAMCVSKISKIRARCLIKGRRGDPLIDRQRQFVKVMEAAGVRVVVQLEEEGIHAIELFDPAAAEAFFVTVKEFINA